MAEDLFCAIIVVVTLVLSYQAGRCNFLSAMCEILAEKAEAWEARLSKSMDDDKPNGGAEE